MTRRDRLVAALLVFAAAPLAAQQMQPMQSPAAPDSAAAPAVSKAPTNENAAVGVRAPALAPAPAPRLPAPRVDTSRNRALMIVGGAALLVGAVIGHGAGTIIMVAGGVTGLYGLYKFLQ